MLIWTPVTEFISDINPSTNSTRKKRKIFEPLESNLHVIRIDSPRDKNKFSLVWNWRSNRIDSRVDPIRKIKLSQAQKTSKHRSRIEIYSNLLGETQSNSIVIEMIKTRKNASFIIDKIGIPGYARTRGWVTINERLLKQPLIAVIAWNKSR